MRTVLLLLLPASVAAAQNSPVAPARPDEIAALIADLGDSSYAVRTDATRKLCAIGMPAAEALRQAAEGDDAERALRARTVLATLERLFFAGTDVQLSLSKSQIAWSEPVDLRVIVRNSSPYPARIPFELNQEKRGESTDDAAQVGAMLDVADWLQVVGPDGERVGLRIDDVLSDQAVNEAVDRRVQETVVSVLDPGATQTLTVPAFNRGWARYPLLDAGTYTIVFDYTPPWEDEALAEQQAGRVVSHVATLDVTEAAPQAVARSGREVMLTLEQAGPSIVARLTNTTDQPMIVNTNLGGAAPFAEAHWVYERNQTQYEVPVAVPKLTGWRQFDAAVLVEVRPGESTELARIGVEELRTSFSTAGGSVSQDDWTVHFIYSNLCDRQWQRRQTESLRAQDDVPEILRTPLPRRLLSARHASNRLTAPTTE